DRGVPRLRAPGQRPRPGGRRRHRRRLHRDRFGPGRVRHHADHRPRRRFARLFGDRLGPGPDRQLPQRGDLLPADRPRRLPRLCQAHEYGDEAAEDGRGALDQDLPGVLRRDPGRGPPLPVLHGGPRRDNAAGGL
ncbi:MAG: Large-conductance mechanosensitive channel, partial [uncultured Thermomicrobiales bacterium]